MPAETIAGRNAVLEALVGRRQALRLYLDRDLGPPALVAALEERAQARGIPVERADRARLDALARDHQGVALQAGPYPYADLDAVLAPARRRGEDPFLLLLDSIQDPQNLGAMLRTAEAAGVHGVVLPRDRSAPVTPTVVRASAGASEHVLVAQVTNLARTLESLKGEGLWLVGLERLPDSTPYRRADYRRPVGLVVGSEGEGLRRMVRRSCDVLVELPMRGRINSLNAATAAAVLMYEVVAQRETA